MSFSMAFEITEDDIDTVLHQNSLKVANSRGMDFCDLAIEIFANLTEEEHDRIANAAMAGDTGEDDDLMAQTDAAHAEIRVLLVELNILKA